jgi:putative transposase
MNDPDYILSRPDLRHEQLLLEAAWRYQLIAPLISELATAEQKARARARLLQEPQPHPWRGAVSVSARSLRRWCRTYRQSKLSGLQLQPRSDRGGCSTPAEALERAKEMLLEDPRRSVSALLRLLSVEKPEWKALKRTTLGRHLRAAGLRCRDKEARSYTKFEAEQPNQLWQGDVLHGPLVLVGDRRVKAKVVCWIDDHSRYVVQLRAFANERLPVLEETVCRAIAQHGRPLSLLVDNGKIYSSKAFTLACSQLEIQKIHAAAYHPETKGKQERFFRTLREQLLNEMENVDPLPLERFNELLQSWLDRYHATWHSSLKTTPRQRFASAPVRPASRELLEEAFLQWVQRKVSAQGVICFAGQEYHADPSLAGQQIIVRFNPFNLERIVLWRDGRRLGTASPETLLRRTLSRPKKTKEKGSSEASKRYLESLERDYERNLRNELNLIQMEEPGE